MNSSIRSVCQRPYYLGSTNIRVFESELFQKLNILKESEENPELVSVIEQLVKLETFHEDLSSCNVFDLRKLIKTRISFLENEIAKLKHKIQSHTTLYQSLPIDIDEDYAIPDEIAMQKEAMQKILADIRLELFTFTFFLSKYQEELKRYRKFLRLIDFWYQYFPDKPTLKEI